MATSCTWVASADWINQVVMLGSMIVAIGGVGILSILRDRRLERELVDEAGTPEPEVSTAAA